MGSAATFVRELSVLPNRYAGQVITAGSFGLGTEIDHYRLPLDAMGFDSAQTIEAVDNIVGDFVGDGVAEAIVKIFRKQPGVIANTSIAALDLIHTSALALEVKVHGYGVERTTVKLRGFINTAPSGRLNLAHLKFSNWLDHETQYTWSEPVTIRENSSTANK